MNYLLRGIDEKWWGQVKALAALRGVSVRALILEAVRHMAACPAMKRYRTPEQGQLDRRVAEQVGLGYKTGHTGRATRRRKTS